MSEEVLTKKEANILEQKVIEKLKEVHDPEIPVNIYELGLIYDISFTEQKEVMILMTLTAPNCPVADQIPRDVEAKVEELDEISEAKAMLTFDPPWDMSMMSDEAKLELGFM